MVLYEISKAEISSNAARRSTFSGLIHSLGTTKLKEYILQNIDSKFQQAHKDGYIHIHDLEGYGTTYNCLTPDYTKTFPFKQFSSFSDTKKIIGIFDYYKTLIANLANEQTGGIGFANFDSELQILFDELEIKPTDTNFEVLKSCIESFIEWLNYTRSRYSQEPYYVSLNLGLETKKIGREVSKCILEYFSKTNSEIIRPNIIFKLKRGVNLQPEDENYDLFSLAISCTSRKMIPTYLLCDSKPNIKYDPRKISVMGCRTRVAENLHGSVGSIGRGNIAYVSINLPRLALESLQERSQKRLETFYYKLQEKIELSCEILIDRYYRLLKNKFLKDSIPFNLENSLWIEDFSKGTDQVFRNGTLSVGFIGLADAIEIITGKRIYESTENKEIGLNIISFMRQKIDKKKAETNLNFTLLATSGEYISGRFPKIDRELFEHHVLEKGYYTNSFHVNVDSGLSPFEKIDIESDYHLLCNGGNISYVEFDSSPIGNNEAIEEIIKYSLEKGISYFGINYPLDTCKDCNEEGTFDNCPKCGSTNIKRIRRVSGYLEEETFFTQGKANEVKHRKANMKVK